MSKEYFTNRSISQPPEIWEQLERIANQCGYEQQGLSKVARLAFIEFIEKYRNANELKALKSQLYWRF